MNPSLSLRLLIATSITLAVSLGAAGLILDGVYQRSARSAVEHRLQSQVYGLLGAADLDADDQLYLPETLPEARYSQPGSGLYALVTGPGGREIWRSPSALDLDPGPFTILPVGGTAFGTTHIESAGEVFYYHFTVAWEYETGSDVYMFTVLESRDGYLEEVAAFRRTLWLWLGLASILLLCVQGGILAWSLAPLRRVADELRTLESGERQALADDYPVEISALTRNLNTLLNNERHQLDRYRNTMADLAHSLKTPLAVLQGWLDTHRHMGDSGEMKMQLERMAAIIDYQLGRSSASRRTFTQPVPVAPAVEKILNSLRKVYRDKSISDHAILEEDLSFHGSEGDLMEILGNLLDNACKYCRREVRLSIRRVQWGSRERLEISVVDDGPGIGEGVRKRVLERGIRLDMRTEGQGIGLAVVQDIVADYGGHIDIDQDADLRNRVRVII